MKFEVAHVSRSMRISDRRSFSDRSNTAQTDEPSGRDAPYIHIHALLATRPLHKSRRRWTYCTPLSSADEVFRSLVVVRTCRSIITGSEWYQGLRATAHLPVRCAISLFAETISSEVRSPGHMGCHQVACSSTPREHRGILLGAIHRLPGCVLQLSNGSLLQHSSSAVELLPRHPPIHRIASPRLDTPHRTRGMSRYSA